MSAARVPAPDGQLTLAYSNRTIGIQDRSDLPAGRRQRVYRFETTSMADRMHRL
jgi:hypothetical protein